MSIEQLIESVEVSAGEKITELRQKAGRDAAEIIKEAEGKDGTIKKKASGHGQKCCGNGTKQISCKDQ